VPELRLLSLQVPRCGRRPQGGRAHLPRWSPECPRPTRPAHRRAAL